MTLEKGKVYVVRLTANTGENSTAKPVLWDVTEKTAAEFYSDSDSDDSSEVGSLVNHGTDRSGS